MNNEYLLKKIEELEKENQTLKNEIAQDKYKHILEKAEEIANMGSGVWDIINDKWIFSKNWLKIMGLSDPINSKEELMSIAHPDDVQKIDHAYQNAFKGLKPAEFEHRIIRKNDRKIRYIRSMNEVIFNEKNQPIKLFGTSQDITAQKQIEQALKESEAKFRSIVKNSTPIIFTIDLEGRFIISEGKSLDALGLKPGQIVGMSAFEIYKDYPAIIHGVKEAMAGKTFRDIIKVGETYFDIFYAPNKDDFGNFKSIIGMAIDITNQKIIEQDLKEALENREILLHEVHHRIKNNIISIEGLLSLQLESISNPEAVSALQVAITRVQGMRILYDKLLFSKSYQEISIKEYTESLVDAIVAVFPEIKYVSVKKQIADFNLNAKTIIQVGIIINELLTNIYKYAFKGRDGGQISIMLDRTENHVVLTIQDNGNGMEEKNDLNKSPGLGLTIVRMLSEQLGGTFTSENHKGTRSVLEFDI
ncbi:MAG: PAS domain S-box protein [Leptospiraceae bacterium]|nr:PAS domain S-box protein [Leptospiraceae bacterium]